MINHDAVTRRDFLAKATRAAFGATIVPRHVLGGPGYLAPSDRVNVALVGVGWRGAGVSNALVAGGQNIVAVADVDFAHVAAAVDRLGPARSGAGVATLKEAIAKAPRYSDFREMLDRERGIDAVMIATPDHTHAIAARRAMELGKHVYVEKPMAHTVHEVRVLAETAERTGVVTQMGNQGRSSDDVRRVYEWIEAGVIGPVREVHVWTDSPRWAQGLPRPSAALGRPTLAGVDWRRDIPEYLAGALGGHHAVPPHLHWDLFLGPAPRVEYHPIYHPRNWRGWTDWGVGAIGDMGAHLMEPAVTALKLGLPTQIQATSTEWGGGPENPVSYPVAMTARFDFPARGALPPVELHWYDGGMLPHRPSLLPREQKLPMGGGLFVGEKGIVLYSSFGVDPRVYPESLREEAEAVPRRYPRVATGHEMNWIQAIRGEAEATSPFPVAAPLTELILLGWVALRAGQGAQVAYDPVQLRVTSHPDADRHLRREYRPGWEL